MSQLRSTDGNKIYNNTKRVRRKQKVLKNIKINISKLWVRVVVY